MEPQQFAPLLGLCAVVAACTTTMGGTAQPADTLGPAGSATTSPTPALVPAAGIGNKLLKREELATIVGDTDLKETDSRTDPDFLRAGMFDNPLCGARLLIGAAEDYSGHVAFAENVNQGARGQLADQAISVWPDRDQATSMVRGTGLAWRKLCPDNQVITMKNRDGPPNQWVTGTVTANQGPSRISTTSRRQEPPPYTCSHVMAAQANVVVETAACGDGDTLSAANQIADRILAKVPQ